MTVTLDHRQATVSAPLKWHQACEVAELEPFFGEAVLIERKQIALFRLSDGVIGACTQFCPKTSAPVMSRGIIGTLAAEGALQWTIASPLHKEVYRLDDGKCVNSDEVSLTVYPARVIGSMIEVLV